MEKGKILLVENSEVIPQVLERHLAGAGFDVLVVKDGLAAMGGIHDFDPDLIISNIRVPGMDGFEICRKLREDMNDDRPFIFITLKDTVEDKLAGFEAGADDYITKPFALEELLARVKANMKRRLRRKDEAFMDSLTGLLNRGALDKTLAREMMRSKRFERPFSIAMVDIDNFCEVGRKYGHLMGDKALRGMAGYLLESFRKIDIVGRYAGGGFVILMPETRKNKAAVPLERIRDGLAGRELVRINGSGMKLDVSIGVAEYPKDAPNGTEIMSAVDAALYVSKQSGRNQITVFREDNAAESG